MNLLFDKEKIEKLKLCSDSKLCFMIEEILKKADKALEVKEIDESYADDNEHLLGKQSQHGNYYEASKPFCEFMPVLGFAYHYTGDKKYFEKAKKLMLLYSGFKKWYGSGFFAKSELNNAHFNFGMACGYDMFYEELNEEDKEIILNATVEKGIKPTIDDWVRPETRVHAMDTMGHNWWMVCIAMAGVAALVMKKDFPALEEDYNLALDGVRTWFLYQGNEFNMKPKSIDDGAFYEGLSYLDFTLREYGVFKLAVKRLEFKDILNDKEILENCSKFYCNTLYPAANQTKTLYFGDMGSETILESSKILLACEDIPLLRWYITQWKNCETTIYDILYYDEIYSGSILKPSDCFICYKNIGWGIIRDSFDKNSSMLGIKCGDTWNHAHADAASFIYYADGEEIIGEGGTCGYGEKEYLDYYCLSHAHNTILFENQGQERRDIQNHTRLKGKLFGAYSKGNVKYICADATGPMARYFRRFLRHFVNLDNLILIYDDLEAYEKGRVEFLLHEKKSGYFKMLTECRKEIRKGFKDHNIKEAEDYYAYEKETDSDGRIKFISLLGKSIDEYTLTEINEAYKISEGEWTIYINKLSDGRIMHKNCINNIDEYETDAILFAVKENQIFFVNASIIKKDGKVIFSDMVRKTLLIENK